ncbi:Sporulation related domain [Chelatococcus sambhunathii]|uniref:Sporulation related domain n=1 Tax=Chelatococcus sambhunathii TaxID=363953 RepID=A0ABM9U178_9HYPH|nr:SPOR domain-containing protein [Chelatococcus sambhunathii]CUA85756.1 Sporulation related domain [Chelatococcus sambhunathii]
MNETAKSRFLLDLDDLERQLRQSPKDERGSRADDPLAELARIVGQDDPFRDLLNAPPQRPVPQRAEPAFDFGDVPLRGMQQEAAAAAMPVADPFEAAFEKALLGDASTLPPQNAAAGGFNGYRDDDWGAPAGRSAVHMPQQADDGEYQPAQVSAYDPRSFDIDQGYVEEGYAGEGDEERARPRRGRKGLIAVASVLAMAAAGVALALNYTGGEGGAGGEPPLIKAAAEPAKIAPQNPGGVEIPNQNKQIYERADAAKKPTDANVVRQSEQPVDVNALLNANGGGAPDAQPALDDLRLTMPEGFEAASQSIPGLGDPRRVKTVAVRPDGSVIGGGQPAPARAQATERPPMTVPAPEAAVVTPSTPEPVPQAAEPPRQPAQRTAPLSIVPQASQPQPAQPARVAAAEPAVPAPDTRPAAAVAPRGGDFAVQLAARPSEAAARESFAQLQRRYSDLGSFEPMIRRAQVGERTVYRLRVGPMSRDEAANLCSSLQSQGGDCFVARN